MATQRPSQAFVAALKEMAEPSAVAGVARFFHFTEAPGTRILGVRIGKVFPVAKRFSGMPLAEIEKLLDSAYYEVRMGAVSIMDFQARSRRTTAEQRKALFDLYLRRHDRINNWDLVDRAAPHVIGGYLADKPRDALYRLARSADPWERRTAIVSTYYFIRRRWDRGFGKPGRRTRSGCCSSWTGAPPPCRQRCCGTRWRNCPRRRGRSIPAGRCAKSGR
jgi:hypothetical protein